MGRSQYKESWTIVYSFSFIGVWKWSVLVKYHHIKTHLFILFVFNKKSQNWTKGTNLIEFSMI